MGKLPSDIYKLNRKVCKNIICLKYTSIEQQHRNETGRLGWGQYIDVLYSFLGIFALGLYIFDDKKDEKYIIGRDNKIRLKETEGRQQQLGTRCYISGMFKTEDTEVFREVVNELSEFASVYENIGNLIPIWPGGNEFKGKALCYDIPDIFFYSHKEMQEVYIQHMLRKSIEETSMTEIMSHPYVTSIKDVLQFDKKQYKDFVAHIVRIINKRTEFLKGNVMPA